MVDSNVTICKSQLNGWLFILENNMKWTKNWGTVSGNAELYMLNHAEHTRKQKMKKKPTGQRLPAFNMPKNK